MDFFLKTEYSLILVIVFAAVSVLISYYAYKNSRIENPVRFILRILRFSSVFLILFLLLSPFFNSLGIFTQKPLNIILIDNSSSLDIEDRKAGLLKYLNENIDSYINSQSEHRVFLFSGKIPQEIKISDLDSIKFQDESGTNLTLALQTIAGIFKNRTIAVVNIFSDGIINEGGNPSNLVKLPDTEINYYLCGDTVQKNDLVLEEINFNKYVYIESATQIKAEIAAFGIKGPVKVKLLEENILIDSKEIIPKENQERYPVEFSVSSASESVKKYKIEIEPERSEITVRNNSREFFIKYINNKINVMVLSGGPGPDYAYISQEIRKINNFEAKFFTQKSGNEYYEGQIDNFNNYQAFILLGWPTTVTGTNTITELKERLSKKNCCIFFIAGRAVDYTRLSIIDEYLPFSADMNNEEEIKTGISHLSNINPELNYSKSISDAVNFPPVFRPASRIPVKPQTETVLIFSDNREPALILSNTADNKSAAMMFYGIYKWRLNPVSTNTDEVLNSLISGSILSILDKEKSRKFFIETTKQIYSASEEVIFKAELTEENPGKNEKIRVRIFNNNYNKTIELDKSENSGYKGREKIESPGEYDFSAELYSDSGITDKYENKFIIGETGTEYINTKADGTILNRLSNETGGIKLNSLPENEIKERIIKKCGGLSEKTEFKERVFLSSNFIYLLAIILLMCTEWFIRKRNNLP